MRKIPAPNLRTAPRKYNPSTPEAGIIIVTVSPLYVQKHYLQGIEKPKGCFELQGKYFSRGRQGNNPEM